MATSVTRVRHDHCSSVALAAALAALGHTAEQADEGEAAEEALTASTLERKSTRSVTIYNAMSIEGGGFGFGPAGRSMKSFIDARDPSAKKNHFINGNITQNGTTSEFAKLHLFVQHQLGISESNAEFNEQTYFTDQKRYAGTAGQQAGHEPVPGHDRAAGARDVRRQRPPDALHHHALHHHALHHHALHHHALREAEGERAAAAGIGDPAAKLNDIVNMTIAVEVAYSREARLLRGRLPERVARRDEAAEPGPRVQAARERPLRAQAVPRAPDLARATSRGRDVEHALAIGGASCKAAFHGLRE